ncbi:MAG TPA: peptidylprolyl isomerase [Alphaproteobacteria bacterium]|nr:peptidylprolyl isomerase [Alphaproteobacteria bacterium]
MTTQASKSTVYGLIVAGLLATTALVACGSGEGTGKTLATVNGVQIRESLVEEQLAPIPAQLKQGREAEARRQILDALIQQQLLKQEVKSNKIESDPEFKKETAKANEQMAINFLVGKKVSETLTIPVLQKVYEENKAQLAFPAVKARHILVPTEAEALNVLKVATPANFTELAKQYSKGPSAENGGELGWFRKESMIPEFATVAFATPAGTVAKQPVKTQFGWHVILVEDKNDHYVPPFEQVADSLKQQMSQKAVQDYLAGLRTNATITYADGAGGVSATATK